MKSASELKYFLESCDSERYFFTRDTMKFFGDTMANYGVRSKPVTVVTYDGESRQCWELYRRRPVKHGLQSSAFFCVETGTRVFPGDKG